MDWLVVTSPENFERTRALRFTVQGFKTRHRSKVSRMVKGDLLAYYLIREGTFAATCRVTSEMFEERVPVWRTPGNTLEVYPWRVRINGDVQAPPGSRPRAAQLVDRLRFVARWPPQHWRLAFQGMLHELPGSDASVIREALLAASTQGLEGHPG